MNELVEAISNKIEILYLESTEFVVPQNFAHLLQDLVQYRIKENRDISLSQLKQQLTKLNYLTINSMSRSLMRESAIKELSRILDSNAKGIEVRTEVETLAFILDRLCQPANLNRDKEVHIETIEALLFSLSGVKWAIPMSSVIKLYSATTEQTTILPNDEILYRADNSILPISFKNSEDRKNFLSCDRSTLVLIDHNGHQLLHVGNEVIVENNLSVQVECGMYKKTAITAAGEVVWFFEIKTNE